MSTSNNPANQPPPVNPNPPVPTTPPAIVQSFSVKSKMSFKVPKTIISKVSKKVFIWFAFTVVIGLLPLILSGTLASFEHKFTDIFDLFIHGELLIVCFALGADAVGDLVNNNKVGSMIGLVFFCLTLIFSIFSGFLFVGISVIGEALDKQEVGKVSVSLLITVFFLSMACKIVSEA